MLHEVLLALSGHPSPLFENADASEGQRKSTFPLLSDSEAALLQSIGRLSERHRKLRAHIQIIASGHQSMICRAVATSIQQVHLARFQKKILDVESKILSKDPLLVGAYNIVPLASVVSEFDDWHRRMLWYWETACFMQPVSRSDSRRATSTQCTGAALINRLRDEARTGFPEIEEAATDLSKVAETAWLRQLTPWLLYGRLPVNGRLDFFVQKDERSKEGEITTFIKERHLLPTFVAPATASSIIFIGKSLYQLNHANSQPGTVSGSDSTVSVDTDLVHKHLANISALSLPIMPAQLSRAISSVRSSLSQNVLQHLLPKETTLQLLTCLRHFFLLARGEFAVALITSAENRIASRQVSMGRLLSQDPIKAMQSLSIKDAELQQVLTQTWKAIVLENEDADDALLDFARTHISLIIPKPNTVRPGSSDHWTKIAPPDVGASFNDLLFPTATSLNLTVKAPLDLFINEKDVEAYSSINAYVLATRRAQLRLSDLWRHSSARRDVQHRGGNVPVEIKARTAKRSQATRKVWATCSAAIFLISETAAYFEGEIVKGSCEHFEQWAQTPAPTDSSQATEQTSLETSNKKTQRDPETLAAGHRCFLASLTYALLLTDTPYTRSLRSLLGNVDALIAFFTRLLDIQQKLDIEADADADFGSNARTQADEQQTSLELDRARKKVDSDLKSVVNRLRQLDQERIGAARYLNVDGMDTGGYETWKGAGGIERLLMKLEFGRTLEVATDDVLL